MISRLMNTETELAIIMIGSPARQPYHIHKERPVSNITSIHSEMFSAFFSRTIFTSCGKSEIAENVLAVIPTMAGSRECNGILIKCGNRRAKRKPHCRCGFTLIRLPVTISYLIPRNCGSYYTMSSCRSSVLQPLSFY